MLYTNVNLLGSGQIYSYIIEYVKTEYTHADNTNPDVMYLNGLKVNDEVTVDDVLFNTEDQLILPVKNLNHWYNVEVNKDNYLTDYIPDKCNFSKIRLYFPSFSVDTYGPQIQYALNISTWINDVHVVLGSYILDRSMALACPGPKKFYNDTYHEYIELPIIDPMDLIYSDDWSIWRKMICGEKNIDMVNTTGTVLYCTLHTMIPMTGGYVKMDEILGGQNSIQLTNSNNDFLHLNITTNLNYKLYGTIRPAIYCNLRFNEYYHGDLTDYLKETYGISNYYMTYQLVIGDGDNVYAICDSKPMSPNPFYLFLKDDINKYNFDNGTGWKYGMNIKCIANIMNEYDEEVLSLISDPLPFTQKLFSYFVKTDFQDKYGYVINNVNLDNVDMNVYNINVVNKTENVIVQSSTERPFENKSNISETVFYRTSDLASIFIYPDVTENICLNLDGYKHLVKTFILQIEGVKFIEIGRVQAGVIFRVAGNKLPKISTEGQYHILNQYSEHITGGKYAYVV